MNIDFSTVLNALPALEQSLEKIETAYRNVEWDDDVHQSYIPYIRECNNAREILRKSLGSLHQIQSDAKNIVSADEVISEIGKLAQQCNEIEV